MQNRRPLVRKMLVKQITSPFSLKTILTINKNLISHK
ncbi:hypothetical protein Cflav_PD6170 [Pedosphaera parvula Ellin514]|uniref:Uncharacterized protein n=1 Tax=Pedosphaera parvula (strain Ellin514) TaxID=320771 RepID=B9XHK2_PEDPL|nr:hypothetical protein Cflav_PD6170 [Pedosphaera parvula Ellin514]